MKWFWSAKAASAAAAAAAAAAAETVKAVDFTADKKLSYPLTLSLSPFLLAAQDNSFEREKESEDEGREEGGSQKAKI